ncbi:Ycf66 family protein [Acaryochloris sp. CCMEE 5410]|uniref:Ycf66 family protein n=1 Tax=Acaryochloris sp. CCMEE 5410 TaxID=310037 RepID=UPI0002483EA7|nr:Ycf66 family protein [Acaryochloris sp. CCMEE 5410]KAI9133915.1 Ycf66 family protein [Acaryochloris sp. CCMEE 5410]
MGNPVYAERRIWAMLSLALVLIVGLGSVGLYLTAYVYPEIHRKTDVWWSGTGLFYALILLIYRRPVGLLLGHTASVVLLVWLSYQALQRRWAMVEANPAQPEPGTWGADARKISDQAIAKITSVNWQGLWEKMGQQADDGTSDKSILPPAIKQRLDLSGLGEKLKGMMGGKQTPEVEAPTETVQPTAVSTPVDAPTTEPPAKQTTEPISDTTVQPAPITETAPPIEEPTAQVSASEEPVVDATPVIEAPTTVQMPATPSSDVSTDSSVQAAGETEPAVQTEVVAESPKAVEPNTDKADLTAELDQVISDLSPDGQDATPNLPQPPDPLG